MKEYIQQALRTESISDCRFEHPNTSRLIHAAMGMCTEAGEFMDALKKELFYGKLLDPVNLKEELGDLLWYIAIAMNVLGTDFPTEMKRNITKLRTRYPEKFTNVNALNRNLREERRALEE